MTLKIGHPLFIGISRLVFSTDMQYFTWHSLKLILIKFGYGCTLLHLQSVRIGFLMRYRFWIERELTSWLSNLSVTSEDPLNNKQVEGYMLPRPFHS